MVEMSLKPMEEKSRVAGPAAARFAACGGIRHRRTDSFSRGDLRRAGVLGGTCGGARSESAWRSDRPGGGRRTGDAPGRQNGFAGPRSGDCGRVGRRTCGAVVLVRSKGARRGDPGRCRRRAAARLGCRRIPSRPACGAGRPDGDPPSGMNGCFRAHGCGSITRGGDPPIGLLQRSSVHLPFSYISQPSAAGDTNLKFGFLQNAIAIEDIRAA